MGSRLYSLDAIRGVAALVVVGYHLHTVFGGFDALRYGFFAVDLFFVLSGYVMARTYEPRFASGLSVGRFFSVRYRRLWGTMAVGTTIGLFFALSVETPPIAAALMFVAGIAFVPLPGNDQFALNRPVWSIFFEIFANVVHAALLWRLRTVWLVAIAAVALALLWPYWSVGNFTLGNKGWNFMPGFARVTLFYTAGIILFRAKVTVPSFPERGAPIASWLGALSFPLYAVHYPLLEASKHYGLGPLWGALLGLGVAALMVEIVKLADRVERGPPVIVDRLDLGG